MFCKMPTEYFSLKKKVIIITGGAGLLELCAKYFKQTEHQ